MILMLEPGLPLMFYTSWWETLESLVYLLFEKTPRL